MIFENKTNVTESEILGEAIYKFRMNCTLDFSKNPKIVFAKEKLASQNFEELLKFLLLCKKIDDKFIEKHKK